MAIRDSRWGGTSTRRPGRRRAVFSLAALCLVAAAAWCAPAVVVLTRLRDRPLEAVFAGIDGSVASGGATWSWWGGIEYRDVVLRDRGGRPLVAVPRMVIDRGLVHLAFDPAALGAVRLIGAEALVEVRRGGSTIEDVLAPWLAGWEQASRPAAAFDLEVVDAAVELVDLERHDAWRITDLLAAGTVRPDGALAGWTVSGRLLHAGVPVRDIARAANRLASDRTRAPTGANPRGQLDRTTVAAGATAILARDGGWSVSSPDGSGSAMPRAVAVAATRLPLGVSSVLATRGDGAWVLDGLADVRLDIALPAPASRPGEPRSESRPAAGGATRISGLVSASRLSLCRASTLSEVVTLDRGEMPIDLTLEGDRVTVRSLAVESRLFRAEASGRMRLPSGGSWDWGEALIAENFALAADVDLAAAAHAMPGGLAVRPDVRVTAGRLQCSAVSRADGNDRVLEIRAGATDLAAVQSVAGSPEQDTPAELKHGSRQRLLRWSEPFSAWLRARRSAGRGERLRVEEARIASTAVELAAAGTAESSAVQWTVDLEKIALEAGEVLDLAGMKLVGTARGRLELTRLPGTAASHAKLSASLGDFEFARPGAPVWRDAEIAVEAEGSGSLSGAAVLIDQGHADVSAAGDALEVTLTGGALVNLAALAGTARDGPWLRAAPGAQTIMADCMLTGDLERWQPRWQGLLPATRLNDLALAGQAKVSLALAAQGHAWQVTRAGGEVEKLVVKTGDRRITEPRVVLSAAGLWDPAGGRLEISSAELLTATLSLRTGGIVASRPRADVSRSGIVPEFLAALRGKLQWQADVARLERWLAPPDSCARWPASGRAWGTAELLDTPVGLNILVESTGSQLTLAGPAGDAAGSGPPGAAQPLWSEPRATLLVEVTCPPGDAVDSFSIDRLKLESSTVALAAAGSMSEVAARRLLDLGGNIAYDWEQVSRLMTPWTGGRVRLAGGGSRPFRLRGPLGAPAALASATETGVTLPTDWLPGGPGGDGERVSRVAVPLAAPTRREGGVGERLRGLAIETQAAWTAAEIGGFRLGPGETPVRFFEGQLALGPFDIAGAGGRIRGAPWLRLSPPPAELIVPPGRCLDRVVLTRELCDGWVAWLVPLIGRSTRTQGLVSVDMAGARVPLADPFGGEAAGQVIFEQMESTPGEHVAPLVKLIVKLQSAIDPRFAFGDKTVLLRVRPEPVSVRLADRRLWHEGLVMDAGQLMIRSSGSVGADGTLGMVVEVAFRGDIAGSTPVVGQLLRTPLVIPLRGTVHRPQFDARSIDLILGRIVENTAEAVIGPQITRGLEALFGNPQPPESPAPAGPAPLELPAGR